MSTRRATPRQLVNLARGREKLFQNQLRKRGIPQTIIQREVIRQPVVNQNTIHQHDNQIKLSLFNELISTKLFSIETDDQTEKLNLLEMINKINARLNGHWNKICLNEKNLNEVISNITTKDKEIEERFIKLEKRIEELEEEKTKDGEENE